MMFWHLSISDTYPMEIRDLRALLAVVRCGSFTAAAKELGYTQSAISQQVAALELELGHQLVQRRPVRPTTAGQRLAEHAARILLRLDVARSELSQLGHEPAEVRVAVCPLAAPQLLAAALREVRSTNPLLRVTIRSVDPRSAVAEVASGAVDAALVDGIAGPDEPLHLADAGLLSSTAMAEAPLVVALPADHPLRNRERIDLDVLADAPWIVALALAGGADERALPDLDGGCRSSTTGRISRRCSLWSPPAWAPRCSRRRRVPVSMASPRSHSAAHDWSTARNCSRFAPPPLVNNGSSRCSGPRHRCVESALSGRSDHARNSPVASG